MIISTSILGFLFTGCLDPKINVDVNIDRIEDTSVASSNVELLSAPFDGGSIENVALDDDELTGLDMFGWWLVLFRIISLRDFSISFILKFFPVIFMRFFLRFSNRIRKKIGA